MDSAFRAQARPQTSYINKYVTETARLSPKFLPLFPDTQLDTLPDFLYY